MKALREQRFAASGKRFTACRSPETLIVAAVSLQSFPEIEVFR